MKTVLGVWINHRKAVIARVTDKGDETQVIESSVETVRGRLAGVRSTTCHESPGVPADDSPEGERTGHLHAYYDAVMAATRDAESILIFGPGDAKGELRSRLESAELGGRIAAVETIEKMNDRQIAAKAREYFQR